MKRHLIFCVAALCLVCLWPAASLADAASDDFKCEKSLVRVASPTKLFIMCPSSWPTSKAPSVEIWKFPTIVNPNVKDSRVRDPRVGPQNITGRSRAAVDPEDAQKLVIDVDPDYALTGAEKYVIAVEPSGKKLPVDKVGFFDLVTDPKASISGSLASGDRGRVFTVESPVGFKSAAGAEFKEKGKVAPRVAEFQVAALSPGCDPDDSDCTGRVNVQLATKLRQAKAAVGVTGLTDIFDQKVSADGTVDVSAPPKGKDDAAQYYQINHQAARGSRPSVGINIKANTLPSVVSSFWIGRFLAQPDIAVDIGTNDLSRKSDDSVRLGMVANRTASPGSFGEIVYGPGILYETNYGFKKNNLIGSFEARFIRRGWYMTREARRFDEASKPDPVTKKPRLSLDDVPASKFKFGSGLEFFLGVETGGSLREQEFFNKAKTASIDVPRYSILRFRPRVHAFIEYDRFTLDWSGTLRLLGRTELVGEEQPDKTLHLRRVRGARGIMETTLSFGLDESKHTSLAITYKRGSQPPNFKHTDSVLTGFVIKY